MLLEMGSLNRTFCFESMTDATPGDLAYGVFYHRVEGLLLLWNAPFRDVLCNTFCHLRLRWRGDLTMQLGTTNGVFCSFYWSETIQYGYMEYYV